MKRILAVSLCLVPLSVSCMQPPVDRPLQRYYDPRGLFSAALPVANEVTISEPGELGPGVDLLSGITSTVPGSSAPARTRFGEQPDQSVFLVWAVRSDSITSTQDVVDLLGTDPNMDVETKQGFQFPDGDGTLVAGTYTSDQGSFGIAGGFIESDGVGYAVLEEYPEGQWTSQQFNFKEILHSFRTQTPPGTDTVTLGAA